MLWLTKAAPQVLGPREADTMRRPSAAWAGVVPEADTTEIPPTRIDSEGDEGGSGPEAGRAGRMAPERRRDMGETGRLRGAGAGAAPSARRAVAPGGLRLPSFRATVDVRPLWGLLLRLRSWLLGCPRIVFFCRQAWRVPDRDGGGRRRDFPILGLRLLGISLIRRNIGFANRLRFEEISLRHEFRIDGSERREDRLGAMNKGGEDQNVGRHDGGRSDRINSFGPQRRTALQIGGAEQAHEVESRH